MKQDEPFRLKDTYPLLGKPFSAALGGSIHRRKLNGAAP